MRKASFLLLLPLAVACNNLENIPFVDEDPPTLLVAENLDLNTDGFIDTVRLVFNENILDEAVRGGDFSIPGIDNIDFRFDTNGDTSHNEIIHLTISDGVHAVSLSVVLTYTPGTATDMEGNLLSNTVINTTPVGTTP